MEGYNITKQYHWKVKALTAGSKHAFKLLVYSKVDLPIHTGTVSSTTEFTICVKVKISYSRKKNITVIAVSKNRGKYSPPS